MAERIFGSFSGNCTILFFIILFLLLFFDRGRDRKIETEVVE